MTDNNNSSREQLLDLIIKQGILHDSEERPVVARDGKTRLSWVMNFLAVSLHAEGLQLAAQEMLKLLANYKGTQLATVGTAAVPLLSACILQSEGHYTGLMVRSKRKAYGTASLIDGVINYDEPVIVIDDSIGSGTNMLDCIEKLEQAGLRVEGCACLVRFGYDSGYAALLEKGYQVTALFDHNDDIAPHHPNDQHFTHYPLMDSFQQIVWDEQQLDNYISPFKAIRQSLDHYWQTGRLLRPPQYFNQSLDTSGGVWLSLRAQDGLYTSQGRHGFWHFPGDTESNAPLDISRVAWLFATHMQNDPHRDQRMEQSMLGLSLMGPLQECHEGDFDPRQHALVFRSTVAPWKMGGGLPNMPGISHAAQLLHHSRFNNTRLRPYEPYQLYRHTVTKLVEPGAEWPFGGASTPEVNWDERNDFIQPLGKVMLEWVTTLHQNKAISENTLNLFIPTDCQWVFLSVYQGHQQLACAGTTPNQMADLRNLVQSAFQDQRWQAARKSAKNTQSLHIHLSFLSQSQYLGNGPDLQAYTRFSVGYDAVSVQHDKQFTIILPEVAIEQQWNTQMLGAALLEKAGISKAAEQTHWFSYRTTTWHFAGEDCQRLAPECPIPLAAIPDTAEMRESCLSFLSSHRQDNGIINTHYHPVMHQVGQQSALFNTACVLWHLSHCEMDLEPWQNCYQYIVQQLKSDDAEFSTLDRSYALMALLNNPKQAKQQRALLAEQLEILQAAFNTHGQPNNPAKGWEQDYIAIELRALLLAKEQGFLLDNALLAKVQQRLLEYIHLQPRATPRQYPALLETLALMERSGDSMGVDDPELAIEKLQDELVQRLIRWQRTDGSFLPEQPDIVPAMFTLNAVRALQIVKPDSTEIGGALAYLRQKVVVNAQLKYFQAGTYTLGGVYGGNASHNLFTLASALLLRVLQNAERTEVVS